MSFLNANPGKTQTCAVYLKNHLAKRTLNIEWEGKILKKTPFPVYLGVTLDRTLSFGEHVSKLRKKLASRNNLVANLANTKWGADPETLRLTCLALCYSTAEFCAAVWSRSSHANKVNIELNKCCRTITGTMKATPVQHLYVLSGIAPPDIRRETSSMTERHKQMTDTRHPLYGHVGAQPRLQSRKSFLTVAGIGAQTPSAHRRQRWLETYEPNNNGIPEPAEHLPPGSHLPRHLWVSLNRARTGVAKTGENCFDVVSPIMQGVNEERLHKH